MCRHWFARMKAWLGKRILGMSKALSRQGLYEFVAAECQAIAPGSVVLNVGAGGEIGRILEEAARAVGFKVVGFDLDPERGPDLVGDICSFDFGTKRFDVVVCCEVLEHLPEPHCGISTIHAILKPQGHLILTTPFMLPMHDRPHDFYRFTRHGLEFLLRDFSTVNIRERNSYFEAIDVLWVRLLQAGLGAKGRVFCALVVPLVYFLKRPLSVLLGAMLPTDAMTTGYVVSARKSPAD